MLPKAAPSPALASRPAAPSARLGTPDLSGVTMREEIARARPRTRPQRSRLRRPLPSRPWLVALITVPTVLLLAAAAVAGPIIYEGLRASQKVFVPEPPRDNPPVIAVLNPAGTPVLATAAPDQAAPLPEWDGEERITLLLLGIDRREDEPARTDTMILVNIDPVAKTAGILSLPRDMKVIVPGYGMQKINAAYAFGDANDVPGGGPGLTLRTIEANFGIRVNYFAQVDFQGFIDIVDAVGGITLDVPYPIKDDEYPASGNNYMRVYFPAGWQHLNGERALQYARTRYDDGDLRRSSRQQQVLLALREQAVSLDLVGQARELLSEVGDSVRTDLSLTQLLQLARLGSQIPGDAITRYSLESALTEEMLPDQPYYLIPDWDVVGRILSEFTGTTVVPPASALANPDYRIPIRVENGTRNPGLAGRVADVLAASGFTNVEVAQAANAGSHSTTRIIDSSGNLATAVLTAGLIGVGVESIDVRPPESVAAETPVASPTATMATGSTLPTAPAATTERASAPTADSGGIVVVLGDDAPDPAYFTNLPIEEPPAEAVGPVEQSVIEEHPAGDAQPDDGTGGAGGSAVEWTQHDAEPDPGQATG